MKKLSTKYRRAAGMSLSHVRQGEFKLGWWMMDALVITAIDSYYDEGLNYGDCEILLRLRNTISFSKRKYDD